MGKKSKRRNQSKQVNKKMNHKHWRTEYVLVDNQTGDELERLPHNSQEELRKRIQAAYAAPPPAQGKPKPDNVVDMEDHRASMREAGREIHAAEKEMLESAKKGTTIASANQKAREDRAAKQQRIFNEVSWVKTMAATSAKRGLTCQRKPEELLSRDYASRKGKLVGLLREQQLRKQELQLVTLANKEGHVVRMPKKNSSKQFLDQELVGALRDKFASEDQADPKYTPIEQGSGGYSPSTKPEVVPLPSGNSEVVRTTSTTNAANDRVHVPNLFTLAQSFVKNVPAEHWPPAICNHVDYIRGECKIDSISLDELSLAEEHGLMRQLTSAMLDYQASEVPATWDKQEQLRLNEWHLRQEVDSISHEYDLLSAWYTSMREKNEQKERQPDTISALKQQERKLTEQLRDTVFARNRLQKQVADNVHGLIRMSRKAKATSLAKRSNDVYGEYGLSVQRHAKAYDTGLFKKWSERHYRKYNPDHEHSVLSSEYLSVAQDKLDKRHAYAERLAEKRARAVERRRERNQQRKADRQARREHAEWVRDNTLNGKVAYSFGKAINKTVDLLNTELNPVLRKRYEQRRIEKQQNKAAKQRDAELKAHKQAARRAFMAAH